MFNIANGDDADGMTIIPASDHSVHNFTDDCALDLSENTISDLDGQEVKDQISPMYGNGVGESLCQDGCNNLKTIYLPHMITPLVTPSASVQDSSAMPCRTQHFSSEDMDVIAKAIVEEKIDGGGPYIELKIPNLFSLQELFKTPDVPSAHPASTTVIYDLSKMPAELAERFMANEKAMSELDHKMSFHEYMNENFVDPRVRELEVETRLLDIQAKEQAIMHEQWERDTAHACNMTVDQFRAEQAGFKQVFPHNPYAGGYTGDPDIFEKNGEFYRLI